MLLRFLNASASMGEPAQRQDRVANNLANASTTGFLPDKPFATAPADVWLNLSSRSASAGLLYSSSMTTREITDADGLTWTCAQAYAGLGEGAAADIAAEHEDGDAVEVVCTPTGAAQTVRLRLASDWSETLSDDDLAAAIAEARNESAG